MFTAKQLKDAGGELRVCGLNEMVSEVFDMSGFSTILNVFRDREEALAGF
jgi:anti-anti-sigma factor